MNEELRIIIRAVTTEARRNLADVREELNNINKTASESGKAIDKALGTIGKGALAAVGAITAVTTAIVALGKRSMEFQKVQAQLIAGFQSVGLSAQQAGNVYKDLFGFLGEADTAVEAANILAQLTQEEANLTEWTQILQGVYAKFPSSLPVESLAEAINHTAHLGEVQGTLADALEWVGVSVESFNKQLATANSVAEREAMIRSTLNGLYMTASRLYAQNNQALIEYNRSQAAVDQALANATRNVIPLMTALNNLSATLLSVLKPAFETVSAVIIVFVQWIIAAIKAIGTFFGVFSSKGKTATKEVADGIGTAKKNTTGLASGVSKVGGALGNAAKQAKELKRQVMGFDELNVLSPQTSAASAGAAGAGAGGGGGGISIPEVAVPDLNEGINLPDLEEFEKKVEKVRDIIKSIIPLVLAVVGGLLLWKVADFITEMKNLNKFIHLAEDIIGRVGKEGFENTFGAGSAAKIDVAKDRVKKMSDHVKTLGGSLLIAAGALAVVTGFSDAWINGIDWKNFSLVLGGIAAIVGGVALAFGPLAAAIALAVGGIVAIVLGIKDFVTNGYSMQSVIMIAVGAIAVLIGVIWALNAALLANPITWIVVAVMALVAVFVILWNECEGFRNFWIELWEKAKKLFAQFVKTIQPLIDSIVFAFKQAWELIKVIWNDYLVPMFKQAWKQIKIVWDEAKPFFQGVWNNIKLIFSVVVDVVSGFFRVAWEQIKAVWNIAVSYFSTIIKNIGLVFSAIKNILSGNFSEAWENVKQIFANTGNFFKGVVNTVVGAFKNIGAVVGDTISKVVKKAINGVLNTATTVINGFIGAINVAISVINAIPGVSIKKLSKLKVPKLATGGIATSATLAMIGERGKEAVLPLENNTQWMDLLAEKIAARESGPTKLVLELDGRELGWANIRSINKITKQTGKLQLIMS